MLSLRITYRLPSPIFVQREPLRPLLVNARPLRLTIHEPSVDADSYFSRGAWHPSSLYRFADLLVIDVDLSGRTSVEHSEVLAEVEPTVKGVAELLLVGIQLESRQWWAGRMGQPSWCLRRPTRTEILDDFGQHIVGDSTSGTSFSGHFRLTQERWDAIGNQLVGALNWSLPRILRSDAIGFRFAGSIRSAILNYAMASESAIMHFLARAGGTRNRSKSIFWHLAGAVDKFARTPSETILAREFEGVSCYRHIDHLFRARNNVAHEGRPYFKTDSNQVVIVEDTELKAFEFATAGLISWLEGEAAALTSGQQASGKMAQSST